MVVILRFCYFNQKQLKIFIKCRFLKYKLSCRGISRFTIYTYLLMGRDELVSENKSWKTSLKWNKVHKSPRGYGEST